MNKGHIAKPQQWKQNLHHLQGTKKDICQGSPSCLLLVCSFLESDDIIVSLFLWHLSQTKIETPYTMDTPWTFCWVSTNWFMSFKTIWNGWVKAKYEVAYTHMHSESETHIVKEEECKQGISRPYHPYQKEEVSCQPGRGKNQDLQEPKTR